MHTILAEQVGMVAGESGEPDMARLVMLVDATYRRRDREVAELHAKLAAVAEQLRQSDGECQLLRSTADEQATRFTVALDYMSQGLCLFGPDLRLLLGNRRYAEVYGLAPAAIRPGMSLREIIQLRAAVGSDPVMPFEQYVTRVPSSDSMNSPTGEIVELKNKRKIAIRYQPMPDGSYVATHEDVTERCAAEARIAHLALHDALTGLPNRVLFRDRLQQALGGLGRGQNCAVLYIDLDFFKSVNDTLGHPLGDALLGAVAERLRRSVRKADTVARIGGDEFAVVQSGVREVANAADLAERLVTALSAPYVLGGHQAVIAASIGIAVAPADGSEPDRLMRNADLALQGAKLGGRRRFRFFKAEMASVIDQRRRLERELRLAVGAREFTLAYQPMLDAKTMLVRGWEALLRWNSPGRGAMAVPEFLRLAEEMGLGVEIGEWVLGVACAEAARWPGDMRLAINVSGGQVRTGELSAVVAAALRSAELPAQRLRLEITEAGIMRDAEAARAALLAVKALGVEIALDDFGTGCSSLGNLREFPFDRIKLDHSFVHDLGRRRDAVPVLRALTGLCGSLGIGVTAEGVETEEQLGILRGEGCDEWQGYLFARPAPAAELPALMAKLADRVSVLSAVSPVPAE